MVFLILHLRYLKEYLQKSLYFPRLEIQQSGEVLKKNKEIAKKQSHYVPMYIIQYVPLYKSSKPNVRMFF